MTARWTTEQYKAHLAKKMDRRQATRSPRKALLKKCDAAFSLLMRAKHADQNGFVKCCTCGKVMPWKGTGEAHWGHWQSRGFNSVRWNEKNGGIQCRICNTYLEGEKNKMEQYLIQAHGETEVRVIQARSRLSVKIDNYTLEALAREFHTEFKEIAKQKKI